ncbi:hypothetical protein [Avibacterium paragallinarum]|uniref:Uncharacterized protein n=1 Tax=Avibacterium paragallinarum TaxID=728 RepID=A0A377I9A4_AVIPA|nr:hypothetical protein [Avibacterium paragallinarum]POY47463.1 hypothetical protein C3364_01815 [Avibacterium paragallinarum]RZN75261.1 hypothetical protein EC523_09180 [Avibacterium paragallinarum]STO71352.1 Uncharacterised protein [Avibacterium paragallinarum]
MRKIIQISSNSNSKIINGETLYALCDDGSIWGLTAALDCGWVRLPDIPQDEPKQTEQSKGA